MQEKTSETTRLFICNLKGCEATTEGLPGWLPVSGKNLKPQRLNNSITFKKTHVPANANPETAVRQYDSHVFFVNADNHHFRRVPVMNNIKKGEIILVNLLAAPENSGQIA